MKVRGTPTEFRQELRKEYFGDLTGAQPDGPEWFFVGPTCFRAGRTSSRQEQFLTLQLQLAPKTFCFHFGSLKVVLHPLFAQ